MDHCINTLQIKIRILNQSSQLVRAVIRGVSGIVYDVACQIIGVGKTEHICIPAELKTQNLMIYMYAYNINMNQWIEFATVPVDSLNVDLLWVTEVNGSAMLSQYGCTDSKGTNGNVIYVRLHSTIVEVMRIRVYYRFEGELYSKKTSAITAGMSDRLWVPFGATEVFAVTQYWWWKWIDVDALDLKTITHNYCWVAYYRDGKILMDASEGCPD